MSESNTQNVESQNQNLLVRRPIDRAALKRRITASLVLVYYIWILVSAFSMGGWWWSLEEGLMWSSGGPGRFFPIPTPPGNLAIITQAFLVDQAFYIMFMHCGVWIVWIVLGLLYLFSPYRIDLRLLRDRVGTRLHDRG